MKLIIGILLYLISYNVYAADVFIDGTGVNGKKRYVNSAHTPNYQGCTDCIISPDTTLVSSAPVKYWKRIGSVVIEMTQVEKDAVDSAEETQRKSDAQAVASGSYNGNTDVGLAYRALVKVILDEINILRSRTNELRDCVGNANNLSAAKSCMSGLSTLNDRTLSQAKTAIQSDITGGVVDE